MSNEYSMRIIKLDYKPNIYIYSLSEIWRIQTKSPIKFFYWYITVNFTDRIYIHRYIPRKLH